MSVEIIKNLSIPDGRNANVYRIKDGDYSAEFSDLGAIWISMNVPDRDGNIRDILLGFDEGDSLLEDPGHMGAVIGRNGNRINGARFSLNGVEYKLEKNDIKGNLHSGPEFYRKRLYKAEYNNMGNYIEFSLYSPHMDQGFPGNMDIKVRYTLENGNLSIRYMGVSDEDTVANFTNHAYFNMEGFESGDISDNYVMIDADKYLEIDEGLIPVDEALVEGTAMDFRTAKRIGKEIDSDFKQLDLAGGYDHNFCINDYNGKMKKVACAYSEKTGIKMEVSTDLPGIQFYTGNAIKTEIPGKNGIYFKRRSGFCFETQFYPDAVNRDDFISPILRARDKMETETIFSFLTI